MLNSIYIIIVSYNGMPWLKRCLDSCSSHHVIVIDNASTDKTVSFIETNYPDVKLLKQDVNLGFGQANNIGIRYAFEQGATHVFLLNQDAYLVDDVIEKLYDFQRLNPKYGIMSPIHTNKSGMLLDTNFETYMRQEISGKFYSDYVLGNALPEAYDVPFVNAAAWLLSKTCVEIVGGFDPLFFHYGEDDNYCQRLKFHNFKLGVLPHTYIMHDREDKEKKRVLDFSEDYFRYKEKSYKLKFANINGTNNIKELNNQISTLKKNSYKSLLMGRVIKFYGFRREVSLLSSLKPSIERSLNTNRTTGMHYL